MPATGASRKTPGVFYDKGGAVFHVQHPDFGAKCDGSDDTAAIQACIDEAPAGSTVQLGSTPSAITGLSITKDLVLAGTGNASALLYDGNGVAITVNSNVGANGKTRLRDFAVANVGGSPTAGILITNSTHVSLARTRVYGFPIGYDLDASYDCHLSHVLSDAKAIGDNTGPVANTKIGIRTTLCNACTVDGQSLVFRTMYGAQLIASSGCTIADSNFEYSGTPAAGGYGVKIMAQSGTDSRGNQLRNNWVEDNDSGYILDGSAAASGSGVYDTILQGGAFQTLAGVWDAIKLTKCARTVIMAPTTPVAATATIAIEIGAIGTVLLSVSPDWVIGGAWVATLNLSDSLKVALDGSTGVIAQRLQNLSAASVVTKYLEEQFWGRDTISQDKQVGALRYTPEGVNWGDSTLALYNRAADAVRLALLIGSTGNARFNNTGAPNNANGANGDFYFRGDGGSGTTIYHKRSGAWVGIL